ncbi:MAG: hypothetical protein IPN86_22625 [Saprospiraceae bacterium]|jgi:hypothetical protein|nr:hypothetical protein [Saprospiraceae bacterium]
MKTFYVLFLASSMSLIVSCSKDDESTIVASGGWKVTLYSEDGKNSTSSFTGYTFDFKSNDVVTAVKNSEVITGLWKEVVDSGRTKFVLGFNKTGIFDGISEDWTLVSKSDTSIKLSHTSGNSSNIGVDILEFGR